MRRVEEMTVIDLIAEGDEVYTRYLAIEGELTSRLRCGPCQRHDDIACEKRGPGRGGQGSCCCLRTWADLAGIGQQSDD